MDLCIKHAFSALWCTMFCIRCWDFSSCSESGWKRGPISRNNSPWCARHSDKAVHMWYKRGAPGPAWGETAGGSMVTLGGGHQVPRVPHCRFRAGSGEVDVRLGRLSASSVIGSPVWEVELLRLCSHGEKAVPNFWNQSLSSSHSFFFQMTYLV